MKRGHRAMFFATFADLEPGLRAIERRLDLHYVSYQAYPIRAVDRYDSAFEIPDLGRPANNRMTEIYVVLPRKQRIVPRRIVEIPRYRPGFWRIRPGWRRDVAFVLAAMGVRLPDAKVRYEVWPVDHPTSIDFEPGGLFDDHTLIAGQIGTMHRRRASRELYLRFVREVLRGFKRVKAYRLGPEAQQLLDAGGRLTTDVKASPMIDLVR